MNPVVLVVAKSPVPGRAKTRLTPPASPAEAAGIAAAALLDTIDTVTGTGRVVPVLALTGELDSAVHRPELCRALAGWTVVEQRGAGLPDRLAAAHVDVAARFPGRPVVQVGMDTPQLTAAHLDAAVAGLAGADALLGPATDGGWWGLALRDPAHAIALRSVPTSRADTGRRTERALRGRGLRVGRLPTLSDVDTMADAVAVAAEVPDGRFAIAVRAVAGGAATHAGDGNAARVNPAVVGPVAR